MSDHVDPSRPRLTEIFVQLRKDKPRDPSFYTEGVAVEMYMDELEARVAELEGVIDGLLNDIRAMGPPGGFKEASGDGCE